MGAGGGGYTSETQTNIMMKFKAAEQKGEEWRSVAPVGMIWICEREDASDGTGTEQ